MMESKKLSQGDYNFETGRYFLCYQKGCKNGERWISKEEWIKRIQYRIEYNQLKEVRDKIKLQRNTDEQRAKRNEYAKIWRKSPEQKDRVNDYQRWRRENDHIFNIADRTRARMREAITDKGYSKKSRTTEILGCDWEVFKKHIESKFVDGMTWENRSLWELDHITPLSKAKTEEEVLKLAHYLNIQPLWILDNRSKGNK